MSSNSSVVSMEGQDSSHKLDDVQPRRSKVAHRDHTVSGFQHEEADRPDRTHATVTEPQRHLASPHYNEGPTSHTSEKAVDSEDFHVRTAEDDAPEGNGCCGKCCMIIAVILMIFTFPFSLCVCIKIVQEYERAVIFRLGRIVGKAKGPGLFFYLPCTDKMVVVDLRTVTYNVPPQEILSKDSVTVQVDAVVYFRIFNPISSVTNVDDVHYATQLLAQTTLRNVLGTKSMSDILSDREGTSNQMQTMLDQATDPWGVKVERVEIKDVKLPQQLQRSMAAEAEATRDARAKVIAAEGEMNASRALKDAADIMSQSPSALQLRYLQTLTTISAEKNSTIIFPLPMDLLKGFSKK